MGTEKFMSAEPLRWKDRVLIAQHELVVVAIVLAELLDRRLPTEQDWSRVTLSLHRLRALTEAV